ncbi:MAG: multiheme c-type cytochrome [Acidiferrobacterales bacterium]
MFATSEVTADKDYWWLPVPPQGEPPESHHPLTRDLSAKTCGLCHQDKYKQWRDSIHAKAMSKGLVGQLATTSQQNRESCLSCHSPRSEQWVAWQAAGSAAFGKVDGIDCAGCHVRAYRRFGPREVAESPHGKVEALPLFQRSEFCMNCHQFHGGGVSLNGKPLENTYNEWKASRYGREGRTCQSCHMPAGTHGFKGIHDPEMTRQGLKVQVIRTRQGMYVEAKNAGAGHALPTYPTPRITLRADTAEGGRVKQASYVIQRRLHWDPKTGWRELSDTRLLPDQSLELRLPLQEDQPATVTVIVQPDHDYHDRVYPMLLAAQKNLSQQDRALLEAARREGINSKYTLYTFQCEGWTGTERPCGDGLQSGSE